MLRFLSQCFYAAVLLTALVLALGASRARSLTRDVCVDRTCAIRIRRIPASPHYRSEDRLTKAKLEQVLLKIGDIEEILFVYDDRIRPALMDSLGDSFQGRKVSALRSDESYRAGLGYAASNARLCARLEERQAALLLIGDTWRTGGGIACYLKRRGYSRFMIARHNGWSPSRLQPGDEKYREAK